MNTAHWTIVDSHCARFGALVLEQHKDGTWRTSMVFDEDYANYYSEDTHTMYRGTDANEAQYVYGAAVLRAVGVLA